MRQAPTFESAFIPPLGPYLIYFVFKIFGDTTAAVVAIYIMNSLFSAACIPVVYAIAKKISTEMQSRLSAVAAALFLPGVFAVTTFSASAQYQFLALVVIYLSIQAAQRGQARLFALLGISAGLLTLARSEFLIPAFLLFFISSLFYFFKTRNSAVFKNSIIAILLYSAIVAPWTWRNYQLYHKFVPVVSHPWHEIWKGYDEYSTGGMMSTVPGRPFWITPGWHDDIIRRLDSIPYNALFEIKADAVFKDEALGFIRRNPSQSALMTVKKFIMLWTFDFHYPMSRHPLYILCIAAVLIPFLAGFKRLWQQSFKNREYSVLTIYAIILIYYSALFSVTVALPRYQIYIFTLILPFVGIGYHTIFNKLFKSRSRAPLIQNQ